MTHPVVTLQSALVGALLGDAALVGLVGDQGVFDAPPKGRHAPPHVVVERHNVAPRDGDLTPGHEHRVVLVAWSDTPSRKAVLAIVDRVLAVAMTAALDGDGLVVTHRRHERTETTIDAKTGFARASLSLRFFSEPVG